jgi:four helix bundle protein
MPYQSFKDLTVWQQSRDLAIAIYRLTTSGPLSKDFGLKDQMQRAAVSVASNIAEGYDRTTDKEFLRFLDIASGSLSELRTQLDIALHIGYIDKSAFDSFENQCCKVGAMMTNLKKARRSAMRQSI